MENFEDLVMHYGHKFIYSHLITYTIDVTAGVGSVTGLNEAKLKEAYIYLHEKRSYNKPTLICLPSQKLDLGGINLATLGFFDIIFSERIPRDSHNYIRNLIFTKDPEVFIQIKCVE